MTYAKGMEAKSSSRYTAKAFPGTGEYAGKTVWRVTATANGKKISAGYVVTRPSKSEPGKQRVLAVCIDTGASCTSKSGVNARLSAVNAALRAGKS
jgi:hypothetical protein